MIITKPGSKRIFSQRLPGNDSYAGKNMAVFSPNDVVFLRLM